MNALPSSLLLACTGVLLAWLLRRPLRRLTGPGPAFCIWLLPLLLAATPWLPQWPMAAPDHGTLWSLPTLMVMAQDSTATAPVNMTTWMSIWLGGCAVMLLRLVLCWMRLACRLRPLPQAMHTALAASGVPRRDSTRLRLHPAGPAVLWGPQNRILLPPDFLERFDAGERCQVLAHELTHLRRGDPFWNLLAELMLAALWFFPPTWLAMSRFRLDQELACDAAVLRKSPGDAGRYARTLLDSHQTRSAMPVLNAWVSIPQLKERLTMIQKQPPGRRHRLAGYAGLATLLAGITLVGHAALPGPLQATPQPAASTADVQAPSADITFRKRNPPRYPKQAVEDKQQGTVVLQVLVDTHGKALKSKIVKSSGHAALDQSATNAAMQWKFNPGMRHGEPFVGWARIPVEFRLYEIEPATAGSTSTNGGSAVHLMQSHGEEHPPLGAAGSVTRS